MVLTLPSAAAGVTKNARALRNGSFHFAIEVIAGTRATNARNCGISTTHGAARVNACVFSRFLTGPNSTFGSTSRGSRYRFPPSTSPYLDQLSSVPTTSLWSTTSGCDWRWANGPNSELFVFERSVATRLPARWSRRRRQSNRSCRNSLKLDTRSVRDVQSIAMRRARWSGRNEKSTFDHACSEQDTPSNTNFTWVASKTLAIREPI